QADEAFAILKKLIELGADVNAQDSYGNAGMDRACLQARQILPRPNSDDRLLTDELRNDLSRIFALLKQSGADMSYVAPNAFGRSYREQYADETVSLFLA
ncbi:MAG: ankyrin repeat domain-containing protein, partial [Clostridia bacterium]|nr:ankyrin repeat domain-containing protein [Clostridia bacterium]